MVQIRISKQRAKGIGKHQQKTARTVVACFRIDSLPTAQHRVGSTKHTKQSKQRKHTSLGIIINNNDRYHIDRHDANATIATPRTYAPIPCYDISPRHTP